MKVKLLLFPLVAAVVAAAVSFVPVADAFHAWNGYHWARTANPFTLKLGDNVSSNWDAYLATTSSDWSEAQVLDTQIVPGRTNPKNCRATTGRAEVCNYRYGKNGWLGIAQIWVSGSHIVKGAVKVNDTYFNTPTYNTPEWRNFVMCQEVGHTLGLDHQDENFDNPNLGTCMDYTRDPSSNQHPNQHDYEELEAIYAHLDSANTVFASIASKKLQKVSESELESPAEWGQAIHQDKSGKPSLYVRDLGRGDKVFTFVIWTE